MYYRNFFLKKCFIKLHKQQQMTSLTSFPFKVYSHLSSFLLIFLEIAVWLTTSTSLFTYRSLILNPHNLLEAALSKDCLYLSSANSFSTALRNREYSFTAEGRRQDVQCEDRGVLLQKLTGFPNLWRSVHKHKVTGQDVIVILLKK